MHARSILFSDRMVSGRVILIQALKKASPYVGRLKPENETQSSSRDADQVSN